MRRASIVSTLAAVAFACAAAAHASGTRSSVAAGLPAPTLALAELNAPTLDPALASTPDAVMIQNALCTRLYAPGGAGGAVVPQIATGAPTAAPDRQRPRQWTTYTIKLHTGYRFQDGTPVTAYSFADAFARDADPDQGSPALAELADVVGATAVEEREASAISGVVVVDNQVLEISTLKPDPKLAALLAQPYFCPVEEETPIAPTGLTYPPSSGPYAVASNGPDEIVLERNPYYRGARPFYASITLRTGVSFGSCQHDVGAGTVDICLDALPQHATTVALPKLVTEGWISHSVGCLAWKSVIRIDLPALCKAS
jgi:ABC-type transport system substrate-binding protein